MRDEVLALLEPGPQSVPQLATWLQQPRDAVLQVLHRLHREEGCIELLMPSGRWQLAGTPRKPGPELILFGSLKARPNGLKPEWPKAKYRDVKQFADLRNVEDSSSDHAGTSVCGSCGRRFTALRSSEWYCSKRCEEKGPPPATVTRVIDGVEYICTSVGSATAPWPESTRATGSSLTGLHGISRDRGAE